MDTKPRSGRLSLRCALLASLLGACSESDEIAIGEQVPSHVFTMTNINADDTGPIGPFGRALIVFDLDTLQNYVFPFSSMVGGPAPGQAMHTVLSPDKRTVFATMSGHLNQPLRLLTIRLDWTGGIPRPTITNTLVIRTAGELGATLTQAHGPNISTDGLLLTMSELLPYPSARLRVVDARTSQFVAPSGGTFGDPGDQSLDMPHGFYPNPSGTLGMSTQYRFDRNKVTVWSIDNEVTSANFGQLTHAVTVTLDVGGPEGSYTHTAAWRNDTEFYTCCTQESTQAAPGSEAGVWHVDVTNLGAPVATQVIGEGPGGALEGVSDVIIANGRLYLAEGNLEKSAPPGHLSVWDISGISGGTPTAPVLIRRFSAGVGLPADFLNTHGLAKTADGQFVIAESYSSNHVVLISGATGNVVKVWTAADGLSLPHGGYGQ